LSDRPPSPPKLCAENLVRIVRVTESRRMSGSGTFETCIDAGGHMCYAASFPDIWRRAATYVDKILKGAKPADLPVEQPNKYELTINLKAAKAIVLTIPPTFLTRADNVIE
jgi:putative ABC transport system substrate-binding protein